MKTRFLFAAAGLLAAGLFSRPTAAQDAKADLPPDIVPATFRMFLVQDERFEPLKDAEGNFLKGADGKPLQNPKNRTGKIHCLVCEYGLAPVVAVFVRAEAKSLGADSGVAKLAKRLDKMIPQNRADKLAGFVVFLNLEGGPKVVTIKKKLPDGSEIDEKVEQDKEFPDEKLEKRTEYVRGIEDFAKALTTPNVPFGLAADKSKAAEAWGVKDTDEVTVIVYYRMRRFGEAWRFAKATDLTDEKVDEILKAAGASFTGKK